jgi:hypothetical protein
MICAKKTGLIIFLINIILLCSCINNKFVIKLEKNDFILIHDLMVEINDKAVKNDIDYFRESVGDLFGREFGTENDRTEYCDLLRRMYQKENLSDDEILEYEKRERLDFYKRVNDKEDYDDEQFIEYYTTITIESLINEIIQADIVKTYKSRANYSNAGINFDYHWDEKDIYFQMYIIQYTEDYVSENAFVGGGITGWKLYSLFNCR